MRVDWEAADQGSMSGGNEWLHGTLRCTIGDHGKSDDGMCEVLYCIYFVSL